jgi:hypothetical protein
MLHVDSREMRHSDLPGEAGIDRWRLSVDREMEA